MKIEGMIWLVDDEAATRDSISQWLELAGHSVRVFSGAEDPLSQLTSSFSGIILTDVKMPGMSGIELQRKIADIDPKIPVLIMTGHGDVAMAVDAIRHGAYDFLEKPFEPQALLGVVERALEQRYLILENRLLRQQLADGPQLGHRLIGNSKVMEQLRQEVMEIADTDASILIQGETGTGKEVVAKCLHDFSHRSARNFVALNCGAIPENIFESELFGHEAGAFTGAQKRRIGKLEHAHGGTLFLDEVTSMPLHLQVKFLRFLQEQEFERLGSNETIKVDIRVISACNTDLGQAVDNGEFRRDLYYRLNVVSISVPELCARENDISLLFEYFAGQAGQAYDREFPPLSPSGFAALMAHSWPGNVRELKNIAERYIFSNRDPNDRISLILGQTSEQDGEYPSLSLQSERFERQVLERSLKLHGGNIQMVMKELDLPRRTLNQKMQKFGLKRREFL